tara:strand:- start:3656 stop:5437 length:1782 start_codon:yes stop_codon:yes gene_type:complete
MKKKYSFTESADLTDFIEESQIKEDEISTIFFDDSGKSTDPIDLGKLISVASEPSTNEIMKSMVEKDLKNSTQSNSEYNTITSTSIPGILGTLAPRPYDPDCFSRFLEINEIHFRAVKTKVQDSIGRASKIIPSHPIKRDVIDTDNLTYGDYGTSVTEEDFQSDREKILDFMRNSHKTLSFEQTCFRVGMDREAIGWSAFEIIRQFDGKIKSWRHFPAGKLHVLEGWEGFVEFHETTTSTGDSTPTYTYYQAFGDKVCSLQPDPFSKSKKMKVPYTPETDGELDIINNSNLTWNLKEKTTGKEIKGNLLNFKSKAANEILFLPNDHSNTRYYGYADVVPAIGAILANNHIRDYLLQFFEHNCVPRYAVIIKGAKVDEKFRRKITEYFEKKVRGNTMKTMVLTLKKDNTARSVDIEFRRIDAEHKEADFLETKRQNDQTIMTAEGVSSALLAINESASLGSGKGMSQAELYKDRIITVLQKFWAGKLNNLFRLGLGVTSAKIEFDPLDVRDALAVAQSLNILMLNGLLSINEGRRTLGHPPIKGGDEAFVRVREGSAVKVSDLPNITSRLKDDSLSYDSGGKLQDIALDDPVVS